MSLYKRRWLVAILHYANLICLSLLMAAHLLSFWQISIVGDTGLGMISLVAVPVWLATVTHHLNRLYFARFGERRPLLGGSFNVQSRSVLLLPEILFLFRSTSPLVLPYATRWLVWFCWMLRIGWLPYFLFTVVEASSTRVMSPQLAVARTGSIWISIFFIYSLPVLYSWHRELVLEPIEVNA